MGRDTISLLLMCLGFVVIIILVLNWAVKEKGPDHKEPGDT